MPGKKHRNQHRRRHESLGGKLWYGRVDEALGIFIALPGSGAATRVAIKLLQNQRDGIGDYTQCQAGGVFAQIGLYGEAGRACDYQAAQPLGMRWL